MVACRYPFRICDVPTVRLAVKRGFADEGKSEPAETLLIPCAYCEHRYLAVPDNIFGNAAQQEMRQP